MQSNTRIISNSIGYTISHAGLALISCAVLFMISDISLLAKLIIVNLPNLLSTGNLTILHESAVGVFITPSSFLLILIVFLVGVLTRMIGVYLSGETFISSIENIFNYSNTFRNLTQTVVEMEDPVTPKKHIFSATTPSLQNKLPSTLTELESSIDSPTSHTSSTIKKIEEFDE
jgi:hypothetical protein